MSFSKDGITLDDARLSQLIKAFSGKIPEARVGIMGDGNKVRANDKGLTNAEVGAMAEFGGKKTSKRSFLRVPLIDHLKPALEKAGLFDKDSLDRVIKEGSIIPWMKKIAIAGLDVVLGAFATGGYGKWKPSDMSRKKVHMTLVETQQLRNSITEEVV